MRRRSLILSVSICSVGDGAGLAANVGILATAVTTSLTTRHGSAVYASIRSPLQLARAVLAKPPSQTPCNPSPAVIPRGGMREVA